MLGRPSRGHPLLNRLSAAVWVKPSWKQERITARSSACVATLGKRSEISIPDCPYFLNVRRDARIGTSLNFENWSCTSPKLSGTGLPSSFSSIGLGSKVSRWLGPPCMKRKMTFLAVAGKCGVLVAIGLGADPGAAGEIREPSRYASASWPKPHPARSRNSLRDLLIDIQKLTHVEPEQAEPLQRV